MTGPGRPTLYRQHYAELARNYCRLGAVNDELAAFFRVSPRTLDNWLRTHPAFASAVRDGRAIADAAIARRLFQRAMGYDYGTSRIFVHRGKALTMPHTVHLPPDIGACIFWLRNRRRQDWVARSRPELAPELAAPEPAADPGRQQFPANIEGDTP
jgi:hypothetical protein